jgi:Mn-dependent DtxR family transcriptional regulator
MTKESETLTIVKEDVVRILGERKRKVSRDTLQEEIKVFYSFISEAIEELEKEGLVESQQGFFQLTERGKDKAKDILRKHLIFENYFKRTRTEKEAHEIAHIVEHYVSEGVFNNLRKLATFKEKGISLTKLKLHKEGLITNIMIPANDLFERIVSMGIFPGEKIMITNEVPDDIIVRIKNKKIALDKRIAKEIEVLDHGKS